MPSWSDLLVFGEKGGTIALLVFIIIAGVRGWWVFGWQYKELQARELEEKMLLAEAQKNTQRSLDLSQQRVQDLEQLVGRRRNGS